MYHANGGERKGQRCIAAPVEVVGGLSKGLGTFENIRKYGAEQVNQIEMAFPHTETTFSIIHLNTPRSPPSPSSMLRIQKAGLSHPNIDYGDGGTYECKVFRCFGKRCIWLERSKLGKMLSFFLYKGRPGCLNSI